MSVAVRIKAGQIKAGRIKAGQIKAGRIKAGQAAGPRDGRIERLLLASEGRNFSPAVIAAAAEQVCPGGSVFVLTIARIWGTALGLPNPWLLPSKHEWQTQRMIVTDTVAALTAQGFAASGKVIGSRNAARSIVKQSMAGGFGAILMGADPGKPRFMAGMFWTQEPQRVRRLASIPVFLIDGEN